jgi:hypothetical protein
MEERVSMTAFPNEADLRKGYVRAFRRAWEDPAFLNLRDASIWQYIFQNAVHEPEGRLVPFNGRKVPLQRGQFITSIRYLAEGFKVSEKVIRRALKGIEEGGLATLQKAHSGTIISVCKYNVYQPLPEVEGTPKGTARAHQGHTKGTNTNQLNKQKIQEAPAYSDSPEGVQGEVRDGHRHERGWSPKVNHPDQMDLITDTPLAADYEPPAAPVPAPESELPLMLSVEGEVMPRGEPVPACRSLVVIPTGNVVDFKRNIPPGKDPDFLAWWAEYPLKVGKKIAADKYRAARKTASAEELLAAVKRYAAQREGKDPRFTAHPKTWLGDGRWMDDQAATDFSEDGGNGKHYDNRRETGPNVNARVFAAILERIAEGS